MIGIYKITNLINNHSYIGQSVNIEDRIRRHKTKYKNPMANDYNKILYKAFRKYGIENFSFEVIEQCSINQLDLKEKQWIQYYNTFEEGYNITRGSREEDFKVKKHKKSNFLTQEQVNTIKNFLRENINISTEQIGKKFNVSGRTIRSINKGQTWHDEKESYPIRKPYASLTNNYLTLGEEKFCPICGTKIRKESSFCVPCSYQQKRKIKKRPSREELKNLIRTIPFTQIGKKYKVTDNAIRKWCDAQHLPRNKKQINQYSEEEWSKI